MDELVDLAQYAVTVKILPSTDIPGQSEDATYAVMADLCSNPIYALNHGYSMSYVVDEDFTVTSLSDTSNWIGTDAALGLMWNSCYGPTGIGLDAMSLEDGPYWACGNTGGIIISYLFCNFSIVILFYSP